MKPPEIDLKTIRLVAQFLNHYAIPGPVEQDVVYLKYYVGADYQLWGYFYCKNTQIIKYINF
jgi:hypothetical protein